ncbi:MAG: tripartite tricarboxylate transporter substrate-binding protein, partial [Acetobacteraceae bacterium]|nr:tripartite tricarboxylate transporter substrate-binding protein [Acetobacteraceae bacterium]
TMASFIKSDKVTALATTGLTRSAVMPALPTVAETVPGYEALIWLGLVAPKGVPEDVVAKLSKALEDIVSDPQVQAAWAKDGAIPMLMQPAAFRTFMAGDIEKWAKVVKLSGATASE